MLQSWSYATPLTASAHEFCKDSGYYEQRNERAFTVVCGSGTGSTIDNTAPGAASGGGGGINSGWRRRTLLGRWQCGSPRVQLIEHVFRHDSAGVPF
jgi:hypothetical protein